VEEVDKDGNAAPHPKKRRVWPVGKEGIRVDPLYASAVTMAGAHLAEWGKGEETFERAADLFNQQPAKPFHVDGKAVRRREERDADVAADGDGGEKGEGGEDGGGTTRSPAGGRSRRRAEIEDEKEEELLEVVRSSAGSSRKAEERRCSAEERRLDLEERKLQHEREAHLAEAERQEAREATSRRAAADALAAAAADREERARSLDLIAALVRRLDK